MNDAESSAASRRLPSDAGGYELVEQIGSGNCTSGVVFRAMCQAIDDEVAVRIIDLDQLQASLEDISKDVKVMSLSSHPNVLPFSTCFVSGNDLWVVMPLLTGGSVTSLFTCMYSDGLPPATAVYVLHSTLRALDYFHTNGQLHRDVRAANILLDAHGKVMLSDYGMMGWMVEGGWERKQRQTFVGTPCWMAPEVMEQTSGYDYKADIWSLGITAIELAMGAAPYVNYPPMKVLVMTLQNPPPTLTGRAAEVFAAPYHDFVAACLEKDPDLRPSAKQLLAHPLFANVTMPPDLETVLAGLPPVGSRGGAAQKMLYRQIQKAVAPTGSGIWNKPSDRSGWDFGDDEGDPPQAVFDANPSVDGSEASSTAPCAATAASAPATMTPAADHVPGNLSTGSFPSVDDGIAGGAGLEAAGYPASADARSATPGTTPSVTPGNLPSIPAFSPPTDGDSRVTLPPSAGGSHATGGAGAQPTHVLPSAVSATQPPGNGSGLPSLPSKSGGLQKKGRFTVSDVDVSAERLSSKLNNFLDDDMDVSPGGAQSVSNGAGGAISNSSSFTSLPGGPSSESSPTSAIQTAVPVVGRAVLPAGVETGVHPSAPLPPPASGHAAKETRKGRFEVTSVDQDRALGSVGGSAAPGKSRSRFEAKDVTDSGAGTGHGGGQGGSGYAGAAGAAGGGAGGGAGVAGDGANSVYSRSPKTGVITLPSARSKDSLPTNPARSHSAAAAAAAAAAVATPSTPSVYEGSAAPLLPPVTSFVQSLTQCISSLGLECDLLRQENDTLRKELAQARGSHGADVAVFRQQLSQQQQLVIYQQAQHEKSIQQLQQKVQQLQRHQDSLLAHISARQQDAAQQPAQVVKLTQGARTHGQQSQHLPRPQVQTSHAPTAPVAAAAAQAGLAAQAGQPRPQLQPQQNQPPPYAPAAATLAQQQHSVPPQAPQAGRAQYARHVPPQAPHAPQLSEQRHHLQSKSQSQGQQATPSHQLAQQRVPPLSAGAGTVPASSETAFHSGSLSPGDASLEDMLPPPVVSLPQAAPSATPTASTSHAQTSLHADARPPAVSSAAVDDGSDRPEPSTAGGQDP
jgi:serine/threonine protein kinase